MPVLTCASRSSRPAARRLDAGVPAVEISSHTGFPETMDGRLEILHPRIHGDLLASRDADAEAMRDHEVIEAADEHGMEMVFTRMRHFRH